jgi:hypothetical protein
MTIREISDEALLKHLEDLIAEEREILVAVLRYLEEVQRRRLYAQLGFDSLFSFAIGRLRLSGDQAQRRIQAMRVMREIPEIEPSLTSGDLSLTNLLLADYHIRQEEKIHHSCMGREEKAAVVQLVVGKSKREAELALAMISSMEAQPRPDSERVVSSDFLELRLTVPLAASSKINALKEALGSKQPSPSLGDLFLLLCDLGIERYCPQFQPAPARNSAAKRAKSPVYRQVWLRDRGKCSNCGTTRFLEVDHILPRALGGDDKLENLRLLCRSCNQRAAINTLGQNRMDKFIN